MQFKNIAVFARFDWVMKTLYKFDYKDLASVGALTRGVLLVCFYFKISLDVHQLLADIRARQMRNLVLWCELEAFKARFGSLNRRRKASTRASKLRGLDLETRRFTTLSYKGTD